MLSDVGVRLAVSTRYVVPVRLYAAARLQRMYMSNGLKLTAVSVPVMNSLETVYLAPRAHSVVKYSLHPEIRNL